MKRLVTLCVFIVGIVLFSPAAHAQQFPVRELGSCSNSASCYNYCQIPENTPACWSYNRFVLHKNVLGEQTFSITFPIAELGNCASAQACREYCSQTANHDTCSAFGKKRGLIKSQSEIKEKLLQAAKEKLGCTDETSCRAICSDPTNKEKCYEIAKEVGLARAATTSNSSKPQALLEKAKQALGCDSQESCMNLCKQPDNRAKCMEFGKKNSMEHKSEQGQRGERGQWCQEHSDQCNGTPGMKPSGAPCTDKESCMKNHPIQSSDSANWQMKTPCKEGQCMNWCQQNPGKCPGFPGGGSSDTNNYQNKPTGMNMMYYRRPTQGSETTIPMQRQTTEVNRN
jgi:hypothetical protein